MCTVASDDGFATALGPAEEGCGPAAGAQPKAAIPATAAAEPPMNRRREMRLDAISAPGPLAKSYASSVPPTRPCA
jgi:hypothetical protein